MYTGIIHGKYPVTKVADKEGLRSFSVEVSADYIEGVKTGASIAVDGICFTVTTIQGNEVSFDAMQETLSKTTAGTFNEGDQVNIERSARMGEEIGGHAMSGHVSTMAEIVAMREPENNKVMTFKVDPSWMKFIHSKGFIGLDGASLTVVDANKTEGTFDVWFIPETLKLTRFGDKQVGDKVNVEIDSMTQTIVETVENYLREHHQ